MFERYTEKARRVIFFARYEASQFGAIQIEAEHILLGLIREDKNLTYRFFHRSHATVESIRREIEGRTVLRDRIPNNIDLPLAGEAKRVLAFAAEESERLGNRHIGTEHLLLGLLREENSIAAEILYERGLRLSDIRQDLMRQANMERNAHHRKDTPHLFEFCRDLTADALEGKLDPLVGRDEEIDRVTQILCRRTKNNPVLIGEPGVGKTAIVEGLAQRIINCEVPSFLVDKRILALDLSLVVAGTKYRGQFEERMKTIMRELIENPQYIVFIDEIHTLIGAGSAEGSLDAANILKPALSRGEIQCIGATTPAEFRKSIERDRSLERRFQAVKVPVPNEEETVVIVEGIKDRYESYHNVRYTEDAIEAAVYQSSRYLPERFQPDKAIDVIDEAGARVKLRVQRESGYVPPPPRWQRDPREHRDMRGDTRGESRGDFRSDLRDRDRLYSSARRTPQYYEPPDFENVAALVVKQDIEDVISRWTGIPISSLREGEAAKLLRIGDELHKRIVGQESAISALARAIRRSRAGLKNPNRPVGSFLFLGPTGVGKTEVARSLADFLFGSERAMIRFDMSEFMEKHSVSKLIGSPPGYVGYEEGGQLTERVRRNPYSVLLLDEIEKAHPDIFNILLQVFEDGVLTDALGNTVDFKHVIVIMTSNLGARFVSKGGFFGFNSSRQDAQTKIEDRVMSAVRETFNPEFINRLDEIIVFEPLTDDNLLNIVGLLADQMNQTLRHRGLEIHLTESAKRWIVEQTCTDRSYGARPLRRALQRHIEDPLSEALIQGQLAGASLIEIFLNDNKLGIRPLPLLDEELPSVVGPLDTNEVLVH
ncbi:MAG TPA: ATP-dependent Clp protease ATP-binding subunit [Blastocatellia bacterium]|nr:ATP-dependent Clp protease ATP-binding subunit [Blastocatellia bacterium]HMV83189.1 ATP-dependent Clp protease ATP-binding subunit [Blastocatellia bacterium]HMZ20721.1 ATP-dependent Clp protease ATP-binding subunit [Blastocatellia bacterium]HNG31193.1 ATP-dependent Clp protease ATP-binding subunit [Blastocatellia bacterium]